MTKIAAVFLVLVSLVCLCEGHDYMLLAQTWPPGFCKFLSKNPCLLPIIQNNFTVHGVWDGYNGRAPRLSPPPTFDVSQVAGLELELNVSWPKVSDTNNNQALWQHEWNSHGCKLNNPSFTQADYFKLGLFWKNKFNIFDILGQNGVHPDPSPAMTHDATLLQNLIRTATGFDPVLHCQSRALFEVRFFLDKPGTQLISCPGKEFANGCSGPITFPL